MYLPSAHNFSRAVLTHAEAPSINNMAKYNGLNNTAIASFHPSATNTPYIQRGICATDDTMLRLASTYAASASRLNRDSRLTIFVGESNVNAVEGSKGIGSDSASNEGSGLGKVGKRSSSVGEMVAKRGKSARV